LVPFFLLRLIVYCIRKRPLWKDQSHGILGRLYRSLFRTSHDDSRLQQGRSLTVGKWISRCLLLTSLYCSLFIPGVFRSRFDGMLVKLQVI
jgi:hypothetical protein